MSLGIIFRYLIVSTLIALYSIASYAITNGFNAKDANNTRKSIETKIKRKDLSIFDLKYLLGQLYKYQKSANSCVDETKDKIINIDKSLKFATDINKYQSQNADVSFLKKQAKAISNQYSQCRLFELQSKLLIDTIQKQIDKKSNKQFGNIVII